MCGETLNFFVPASESMFPCMTPHNKTIFFVVVDVCKHGAPASKRGPMKSANFTEKELVLNVKIEQGCPDGQPVVQELPQ
jgi:hypothetical protein